MNKRIYGIEMEYGSITKDKNGCWVETIINHELLYTNDLLGNVPRGEDTKQFIGNGARIYIDCGHIEYATPECISPKEAVAADIAGGEVLQEHLPNINSTEEIVFIKENFGFNDAKVAIGGANAKNKPLIYAYNPKKCVISFGCHENYSLDTRKISKNLGIFFSGAGDIDYGKIKKHLSEKLTPFFITRQILSGAGSFIFPPFFISPRSNFITNQLSSLATENSRSIIDTRNQSHGIVSRLHIILGEGNMAEVSSLLKIGTTGLMLSLLEDGFLQGSNIKLTREDMATHLMREIATDISCSDQLIQVRTGEMLSACQLQRRFYKLARKHYPRKRDPLYIKKSVEEILYWWNFVLTKIEAGSIEELIGVLDWPTKLFLGKSLLKKYGLTMRDLPNGILRHEKRYEIANNLRALDQRYHELSSEGYYYSLKQSGVMHTIISRSRIEYLMHDAPQKTRAHGRGLLIKWVKQNPQKAKLLCTQWDAIIIYRKGAGGSFHPADLGEHIKFEMADPFIPTTLHIDEFLGHNESKKPKRSL